MPISASNREVAGTGRLPTAKVCKANTPLTPRVTRVVGRIGINGLGSYAVLPPSLTD